MLTSSEPAHDSSPARGYHPARGVQWVAAAVLSLFGLWALGASSVLPGGTALGLSFVLLALGGFAAVRFDWLHRSSASRLVRLGVPVILAMMSQTLVHIVDTAFVGSLPEGVAVQGAAAIGISLPVFWLVGGFLSAIGIGTQAIVARRVGQGDDKDAGSTLMTAVIIGTLLGVLFSVLSYLAMPTVMPFLNADPGVLAQSVPFATIRSVGIWSMVLTHVYKAFFDGTGRTYVHMGAAIIMNVVNAALCYGLVFGELGMPRLEVAGAAWASTISSIIGTSCMIAYTFHPALVAKYRLYRVDAFSLNKLRSIVALSLPSGAATVIAMLGFLMFHKAVAAVDAASASGGGINAGATAVIQQIVLLVFMTSFALGTATATLVSQSMGARDYDSAARYTWESVKLGTFVTALLGTVIFIHPELALGAFIRSNEVGEAGKTAAVAAGVTPLRIIALASMLISAAAVFTQALNGAGNTRFVMWVEGVLHITCLVPLAWLFGVAFGGGLLGIWCAAALYVVLLAGIMGWKFAEGSWRHIQV